MKTQLSKPAGTKARYTEEYKKEALRLEKNQINYPISFKFHYHIHFAFDVKTRRGIEPLLGRNARTRCKLTDCRI
jgi:hypothetical protein